MKKMCFRNYLKKRLFKIILFLSIPLVFTLSLQAKKIIIPENDKATVLKVTDGDTLKILYNGTKENLRLIGIDAPESRANKKAERDAYYKGKSLNEIILQGKEAHNFVKSLVKKGDIIKIEFDVQVRDEYGSLVGYVYLVTGKMLNEEILKAGYANIMTVPPNVKYEKSFSEAYRETRAAGRGLWSMPSSTNIKPKVNKQPQDNISVYITKSGSKYHSGGCNYLRKSKTSISLKKAKERGYTPCSVCHPPR